MKLRDFKNAYDRRSFIEKETDVSLGSLGKFGFEEEIVSSKNCENLIGAVHIPVGVVGPLKIRRETTDSRHLKSHYYIPLATTEGALVASINRGCRAISESGGATVSSELIGVTRGSVFKKSLSYKSKFNINEWLWRNLGQLRSIAGKTSDHIILLRHAVIEVGRYIFIRWYFDTADAMGMNMATMASQKLAGFIEKESGAQCIALAGNYDIDKKPAWINAITGRGRIAMAEVLVPKAIVSSVLKTTPYKIEEVWKAKCMIGSALSGSLGFNAHFANVIAALFIATGQDPAHVVEGSNGITTIEVTKNGDLYCSVYLPSLMVGTVGGGTGLSTQKEGLSIMSVSGTGKVEEFAGIVAGAVLAGEISLLASLAEGSLARAHKKLGR